MQRRQPTQILTTSLRDVIDPTLPAPGELRGKRARVRSIVRSAAFAGLVSRGAGMAGAFGLSVAILRSMSASDAGLVLLIYTLITIAATLARFGSDNLALREVSKTPRESGPLIRHAFTIAVLLTPRAALLLIGAVVLVAYRQIRPSIWLRLQPCCQPRSR